jgi:hypothetical protein
MTGIESESENVLTHTGENSPEEIYKPDNLTKRDAEDVSSPNLAFGRKKDEDDEDNYDDEDDDFEDEEDDFEDEEDDFEDEEDDFEDEPVNEDELYEEDFDFEDEEDILEDDDEVPYN